MKIPCDGEYFLSPIGVKFVPELEDENDLENFGLNEGDKSTSVTLQSSSPHPHPVVFPALGESESSELFNDEPIVGVEVNRPQNRVRPPKMIALAATKESITWQLSELDPKIGIEKYQVPHHLRMLTLLSFWPGFQKQIQGTVGCIHKVFMMNNKALNQKRPYFRFLAGTTSTPTPGWICPAARLSIYLS